MAALLVAAVPRTETVVPRRRSAGFYPGLAKMAGAHAGRWPRLLGHDEGRAEHSLVGAFGQRDPKLVASAVERTYRHLGHVPQEP